MGGVRSTTLPQLPPCGLCAEKGKRPSPCTPPCLSQASQEAERSHFRRGPRQVADADRLHRARSCTALCRRSTSRASASECRAQFSTGGDESCRCTLPPFDHRSGRATTLGSEAPWLHPPKIVWRRSTRACRRGPLPPSPQAPASARPCRGRLAPSTAWCGPRLSTPRARRWHRTLAGPPLSRPRSLWTAERSRAALAPRPLLSAFGARGLRPLCSASRMCASAAQC
mmetsp:Transcript_26442/g.69523  ORF Transcript_26442/g.69523 Transcript_26442/m.69523 type:complete len:227 (+) Transcript_26442:456-1136(+)